MGRRLTRSQAAEAAATFAALRSVAETTTEHAHGRKQKECLARVIALVSEMVGRAEDMLDALPPNEGPRRRIGSKRAGFVCAACYPHPWHKGPCPHCTCGRML